MRMIVQDINELSDSREILESKPHLFIAIFMYIILTLFLSSLVWAWFSEKEIVIKASGIIKPQEDVYKIANPIPSKVDSINLKNGREVKKDEILYTLEHKDLDMQKESLEKSIKDKIEDVENLKKLKNSVEDGKNYFNKDNEKEKQYYNMYVSYETSYKNTQSQSHSIASQKDDFNNKIFQLNLLQKSIDENKNNFSQESIYFNQFIDYKLSIEQYESKINQAEKIYNSLKGNNRASKDQVGSAWTALDEAKKDLEKYKNQYYINIKVSIAETEGKIKELDSNLGSINQSEYLTKENSKIGMLVQIDDRIKVNEEKLQELNDNLKALNMNIDKCNVKAPYSGIVDMTSDIKIGDMLQVGVVIANILPNDSKYKVEMYISNKDIANIKEGQEIKYQIDSLPYKEYGYASGKIKNIGADSKVNQQTGTSFYIAEAYIDNNTLYSHKGEEAEIKNGMVCEGKVVVRREKVLYYLLKKLDLKD